MVEVTIINIVGTSVLATMLAYWFQPIQGAKDAFISLFKFSNTIFNALHTALNCSKCLSFWTGLIVFQDILAAGVCSLVGYLINHLIDRVEHWYE